MLSSVTPLPSAPPAADPCAHRGARRSSPRIPITADVEVVEPARAVGIALNASEGGLRVAVDKALYVEDVVTVRLTVEGEDSNVVRARVVWVRELKDGWVAGLELLK